LKAQEDALPPVNPIEVVLQFEQRINSRSAEAVCALLTPDTVFIDSLGNKMQGTEKSRAGWEVYFKMVPDYLISHTEIFGQGDTVAIFGMAQGTYSKDGRILKENFWKTPAAWRAEVKDGKIAVWQVFVDNEPIREVMRRPA
jgi:ketosteroid isomerase-like protein